MRKKILKVVMAMTLALNLVSLGAVSTSTIDYEEHPDFIVRE